MKSNTYGRSLMIYDHPNTKHQKSRPPLCRDCYNCPTASSRAATPASGTGITKEGAPSALSSFWPGKAHRGSKIPRAINCTLSVEGPSPVRSPTD
jgi:hypothetical protein